MIQCVHYSKHLYFKVILHAFLEKIDMKKQHMATQQKLKK